MAYLVSKVSATRSNYKLLLLLYWQVFDEIEMPKELINAILERATEPESIGRLKRKAVTVTADPDEIKQRLLAALNADENDITED